MIITEVCVKSVNIVRGGNLDRVMNYGIHNAMKAKWPKGDMWDEVDRARRGMQSNAPSVDCVPMVYESPKEKLPVPYHRAWANTYL